MQHATDDSRGAGAVLDLPASKGSPSTPFLSRRSMMAASEQVLIEKIKQLLPQSLAQAGR
jgi:hypothetical protein